MKKIIFLLILILQIACKKNNPDQIQYDGTGNALLNGKKWESNIITSYIESDSCYKGRFSMVISNSSGSYISENISLNGVDTIPLRKNIIDFKTMIFTADNCRDTIPRAFVTITQGGDNLTGHYRLLERNNVVNQIKVINFDSKTNELTASFQLNFLIDTSGFRRNLNGLSDTLRFTDGWFKTKIRFSKR